MRLTALKRFWNCAVKEKLELAELQAAPAYQVRVSSEWCRDDGVRDRMPRCLPLFRPTAAMQRRAWGVGWGGGLLIDTEVVREVVTGFSRVRFELENCRRRQDSNLPLGYGIRSSYNYFTSFLPRHQTYSVQFSKRAFYGSINKYERTFVLRLTQKW